MIATDHAPHTAEQKSRGLAGSAMGIVGLECAFPLLYTYLVKPGLLTLEQLVERMSMAPRRIFGLGGGLQAGEPADLTVFDLDAEYEIDPETFLSKGRATPLPAGGLRAVRSGRWSGTYGIRDGAFPIDGAEAMCADCPGSEYEMRFRFRRAVTAAVADSAGCGKQGRKLKNERRQITK